MRIAVIVDDLNPDRRRHCFWEVQLRALPNVQAELVCLNNQISQQKFFDVHMYDIIIFNWDSLNNDVMFDADRNQTIIRNDKEDFTQFVQDGGILIIEDQARHWLPVQDAYDALLSSGQITVLKSTRPDTEEQLWGATARVNRRFKKHPLIHNLPRVLHSAYSYPMDFAWFPPNTVRPRALQGLHPTKLYAGAFQKWKSEWLPLIYTDDEKYPVMLVKTDGLGLWVVSTMFLASADPRVLIENLIMRAKSNYLQIKQYHSRHQIMRIMYALRAIIILILVTTAAYIVQALHIFTVDIPYSSTIGGNITISLLITLLSAIAGKLLNYVLSSLRSAFNK